MIAVFLFGTFVFQRVTIGISIMEIVRGLQETKEYLESMGTSGVSECAYGKMKRQQLTSWTNRIKAAKLTAKEAGMVIEAVQQGKWAQEEKDALVEAITFEPGPAAPSGSKTNRPRQELKDFGHFLRRSDVDVLQSKTLSWVSKMDHIAEILCQLHLHLPTEKTMGHILENLSL